MMKKTVLFVITTLTALSSYAGVISSKPDTGKIYTYVTTTAEFRGGFAGFDRYVDVGVSKILKDNHRLGVVMVELVVEKDGKITAPKIIRRLSPETDSAAILLLKNSPLWRPGFYNGKAVRTLVKVAVKFKDPTFTRIVHPQEGQLTKGADADITIDEPVGANSNDNADSNLIYTSVEKAPAFPGGMEAFWDFIKKNLKWPANSREVEGRVILTFVVEKDGSLTDIKVVRSITPELDAEAVRLVKGSPRWTPAMVSGKPVRVQYSVPISFRLGN